MQLIDIQELLDRAKQVTQSDYETAKRIGVDRQRVSNWRNGRQPMPVGDVVLVAELAGLDALGWCARAVAESYKDTPKGEAIRQALKKVLVATGGAIAIAGAINVSSPTTPDYDKKRQRLEQQRKTGQTIDYHEGYLIRCAESYVAEKDTSLNLLRFFVPDPKKA